MDTDKEPLPRDENARRRSNKSDTTTAQALVRLIGFVFTIGMAVRTALEDATLQAELAGYREYAAKIRWRLIPYFW